MAFTYLDEPIRYNEGKVDWTLLPWNQELISELVFDLNYYSDKSVTEIMVSALHSENVKCILVCSLLLADKIRVTFDTTHLPWNALEDVCRVFQYGCVKYQRDNYKLAPGLPLEGYIQSMWRHTVSYLKGEELDTDSGLPNLAHLACNAFMYLWTQKEYHNEKP